ncbi:MAG: putative zinc-binding metallopeptidase [Sphingobacteriaceae bacterium]|nr:putative zinc-binding metallopeptidase [Sphingobacteriaceae bacterium]
MYNTEVYWCPLPQVKMYDAAGFFFHGTNLLDKLLGYKTNHIYIPAFVLSNLFWQHCHSLQDIIRHEYAHAFAHYYPELIITSKQFNSVFGGEYFSNKPSVMEHQAYVSEYAKTLPMEDFAETFMVYVRRKGRLPNEIKNIKLKRKWKFISQCIKLTNR